MLAAMPEAPKADGPVLRDIHLPPAPSWWPPAPGWWVLAVVVLIAVCIAIGWRWRRRHRQMRIAAIVAEVDTLAAMHADNSVALAGQLHQLLRRAARKYDARATHYRGDEWATCLAKVPVPDDVLRQLQTLEIAMYRPSASFDASAAVAATRQWLLTALQNGVVRTQSGRAAPHAESERV